jgi:hypothetical protein
VRTDYFDIFALRCVTTVTSAKLQLVTPKNAGSERKSSNLQEVLPALPLLPEKTDNTKHDEAIAEHLAERAAIMEYDGGLSRDQAESEARKALRVFEYQITDNPGSWLTMIAPGCTLEEAAGSLRVRYRERLLAVKPRGESE